MAKKLTKAKAKEILHDGTAHGKKLTDKQHKFFAAKAYAQNGESISEKRKKELLSAANKVAKTQGNSKDLENLLIMTAYEENTLGEDPKAYGRQYTKSMMSIDPIMYDDLFKKRGEGRYTSSQNKYFDWLKSGFNIEPTKMDSLLTADNPEAAMAAARMVYGRASEPIPSSDDAEAMYDYYIKYYNKGGADKYKTREEGFKRFKEGYDKYIKPPKKQIGGEVKAINPNLAKNDLVFKDWYTKNTLEGQSGIPYSEKLGYDYYSFFVNKGSGNIDDHFPDTFKRKTHPTFSNESIYSTPENPGGSWIGEKYNPRGKFIKKQEGGVIKDDRGQWAHPGKITEINSPNITMKGVNYPVLGVSDMGDTKMMYPENDYKFIGNKVTEYPMKKKPKKLDDLTNFSNYNKKAQWGDIQPLGQINPNANIFNVAAPTFQGVDLDPIPGQFTVAGQAQQFNSTLKPPTTQTLGQNIGGLQGALNIGQNIIGAIGQIKQEKNQRKQAKQEFKLSQLTKQVSELDPERVKRKYHRPEDQIVDPNQVAPSYGVGTNYLKDGGKIKGYQFGGALGNAGQMLGSWIGGGKGAASGAGQLGSTIGSTVGKFIPIPGAGQVLSFVGGAIGGLIGGKNAKQTAEYQSMAKSNNELAALNQSMSGLRAQNSAFMEHGGKVGMEGDLVAQWGGNMETISANPYDGETIEFQGNSHSETDGQGRTGIGISYGNNPVEVEDGETAIRDQKDNLVIYGNMKIPSFGANLIGDENAKGKKFKNYVKDLSEQENKQSKVLDKGLSLLKVDPTDKFDKLKFNSGKALLEGSDMKMKDIANKKKMASAIQNAILDTAEEFNLESDALAKGKIKKAKKGAYIPKYQDSGEPIEKSIRKGIKNRSIAGQSFIENIEQLERDEYTPYGDTRSLYKKVIPGTPGQKYVPNENAWWRSLTPEQKAAHNARVKERIKNDPKYTGTPDQEDLVSIAPQIDNVNELDFSVHQPDGKALIKDLMERLGKQPGYSDKLPDGNLSQGKEKKKFQIGSGFEDVLNAVLPYIRPSNQLARPDLSPEMMALASNQLDPVQAQLYHPLLEQASDISLQDQMNANQADFNALQRLASNNPAALSSLAAQKYKANSAVLAEQFRQNQAQKMGVYNRNRATLNDAQLKNLGILDNQYVRQATAKSKTKDTALAALSSMSDKIAKNNMENRVLDIYENLYNYRFGPNGQAWNLNPLAKFNTGIAGENLEELDENGKVITTTEKTVDYDKYQIPKASRMRIKQSNVKGKNKNGAIVKALKNI